MQINNLKIKTPRKKRRTVGRGGKKGTYCGKGCKGQKARSGGNVDPLFEGGRSTLIDHMKKKRGFKSRNISKNEVKLSALEKNFKDGENITIASLVEANLIGRMAASNGVKILFDGKITKKFSLDEKILFSASAKNFLEKNLEKSKE